MKVTVDAPEFTVYDFIIKVGATEPAIQATLRDDTDSPIDLSGSSVVFRMKDAGADSLGVDGECTITDASNGQVTYTWKDGDTADHGHYNAEFAVDYDDGSPFEADEYFPSEGYMSIKVEPNL